MIYGFKRSVRMSGNSVSCAPRIPHPSPCPFPQSATPFLPHCFLTSWCSTSESVRARERERKQKKKNVRFCTVHAAKGPFAHSKNTHSKVYWRWCLLHCIKNTSEHGRPRRRLLCRMGEISCGPPIIR